MSEENNGNGRALKVVGRTKKPNAAGYPAAGQGVALRADSHALRLERIRREIEKGTYETEGKLRIAISRLIDDVFSRRRKK